MTEQELLEKIKASADEIEIPGGISPEQIQRKLKEREEKRCSRQQSAGQREQAEQKEPAGKSRTEQKESAENRRTEQKESAENRRTEQKESAENRRIGQRESAEKRQARQKRTKRAVSGKEIAAAAAVAVLLTGLGGTALFSSVWKDSPQAGSVTQTADSPQAGGTAQAADSAQAGSVTQAANSVQAADSPQAEGQTGETEAETGGVTEPKKDAGALYVVAENYGDVFDLLNAQYQENHRNAIYDTAYDTATTGTGDKEAAAEDVAAVEDYAMAESATSGSSALQNMQAQKTEMAPSDDISTADGESYSRTNVQTAGVDESDIVKTDGSYIYVVCGDVIKIADVRGGAMKMAGEISISMDGATNQILEMYVDGNVLNLIVQKEKTKLAGTDKEENKAEEQSARKQAYYMETSVETELLTYDITDRSNPVLSGSITQDGFYKTSRKMGDIVYLFTQEWMNLPGLTREEAVTGENAGGWIPLVNGEAVAADCIYVPEYGESGLVISSTDIREPDKVVDNTMIINDYVDIYVSNEALYLYGTDYRYNSGVRTQIAKFSLKDGVIQAVGATQAAGEVRDTFAINEYQGTLRLLTTDWSKGENENQLYLFDENLNLTGKLFGIAKGEQIYAARYFGDTAYFVTYRNTDPLFAVDLSDEKNPKILSELKITGFSEYLHFWGKDKLVGIGYETDPNNGAQEGIKLTMFDISNPADLKTLDTCVLRNLDSSPALYDYKCVLADAEENLLGFAGETYDRTGTMGSYTMGSYLLFTWEDGKFKNLLTEELGADAQEETEDVQTTDMATVDVLYTEENIGDYRGLYVGQKFYLVNSKCIISYDREAEYRVIQKLKL